MRTSGRTPSPLGLILIAVVTLCTGVVGANLGRGWLAARATEVPVTARVSPPPPVSAQETGTPEVEAKGPETGPTPAPAIGPQLNVALVVVDSLEVQAPALQGVWIAALHTEMRTAFLLGLSPDLWVKTATRGELRLRDTYAYNSADGSGGPEFEAVMHNLAVAPLVGTVTVDELLLSEIVNRLGGVDIGGARMDGAGAVAHAWIGAPPDPLARSDRQTEFAYALRDAAAVSLVDGAPYLELILQRGETTIDPDILRALADAFKGYNPANTAIAPPVADPQLIVLAPDGLPAVLLSQDYLIQANTALAGD